jgi:MmyB-like transcription regulator ligand binding domain
VLDPKVARPLRIVEPHPASITGARYDLLGWIRAAAMLFPGFRGVAARTAQPLLMGVHRTPRREVQVDWAGQARALLARFRAAAGRPDDDPGPRQRAGVGQPEIRPVESAARRAGQFERQQEEYVTRRGHPGTTLC